MSKIGAEGGPPEQTKVGCCNYICRWVGGCDLIGQGTPNLREGVLKKRACTDIPWLVALLAFSALCVGMIWIPAAGEGEWERFTGASDYLLNTCDNYAAWPNPLTYDVKVCVDSCDEVSYAAEPKVFWCLPDSSHASYDDWKSNWEDNTFVRLMSDMYTYRQTPLVAIGLTFVFIILFFVFVRFFLKMILRLLYVGIFVGTIYGGYSFMQHGKDEDPEGYYTGVAILCVGGAIWCIMMVCWSSLVTVVTILEKASKALMVMPQVMLCPILTMPFSAGIIIVWYCFVLLMCSSTTDPSLLAIPSADQTLISTYYSTSGGIDYSSATQGYKREYDTDLQNWFWVHLFWMFWAVTFMEYFNFLIVSGCVADWFLDKELVDHPDANEEFRKGNCRRLFGAIWRTIRYHLGTVAFASALIAAIKTIETILVYIKNQIGDDTTNPFAKIILKITIAVVHCLKCILDRCNKMTLVVTAVCGSPFCAGCGKALGLFFRNMALMSLGTGMVVFMCLLANFFIAILSAGTAGYIFLGEDAQDLNSSFMPLASSFIVSFFVAKIILGAWDCAATTILVCQVMLQEWYPEEVGKNLVAKAKKVNRIEVKAKDKDVEMANEQVAI